MKKILGYSILVVMFAVIFGTMAYFAGFKVVLCSVAFTAVVFGLSVIASKLINDEEAEKKRAYSMSKENETIQRFTDQCYEGEMTRRDLARLCFNEGWLACSKYKDIVENEKHTN